MLVSDFDYVLPPELIAQAPLEDRAASRMLHLVRASGQFEDRHFREFPDLLGSDDLVVFNNTRVFPARLYGRRSGARSQPVSPRNPATRQFLKGRVEVLLTAPAEEESGRGLTRINADETKRDRQRSSAGSSSANNPLVWNALVRPGRKIGVGERLFFGEHDELQAEVMARGEFGERTLRFEPVADFFAVVERIGHVPLPPYIGRPDSAADRERYQTIYARERGSAAAPTAGLHFTPEVLERMRQRGVETAEITLHVGLGTFQPVHVERVEEHKLHREWYSIAEQAAAQINRALQTGRRIVAVGTTTVRTLEYAVAAEGGRRTATSDQGQRSPDNQHPTRAKPARAGTPDEGAGASNNDESSRIHDPESRVASGPAEIRAGSGEADLFIFPGFQFHVVSALLTNFHLPKSTLLMLVSAFAGRERVLAAYKHAVEQRYRFYSYGDCMFVE